MPPTYYELLVLLSEAPQRTQRMSELAHWTNSKPSRITHAINRLEAAGWMRREHYSGDRRGWLAVLTDRGQAALEVAAPRHLESVRAHLIDLLTPAQIRQLADISQVILDHLLAADALPPGEPDAEAGSPSLGGEMPSQAPSLTQPPVAPSRDG